MCNQLYDMPGLIQRYMAVCLKMGRTPWLWQVDEKWWKGVRIEKGTWDVQMMDEMFKIQTFQVLGICTPLTPFWEFPTRSHGPAGLGGLEETPWDFRRHMTHQKGKKSP